MSLEHHDDDKYMSQVGNTKSLIDEVSGDTHRSLGDAGLFAGKKESFSPEKWRPNPPPRYPGIGNIEASPPVPQPGKGHLLKDRMPMNIRGR